MEFPNCVANEFPHFPTRPLDVHHDLRTRHKGHQKLTSPLLTVERGIRDYQRCACSKCFRCFVAGQTHIFGKTGSLRNEDVKPSKYQRIFHDENRMGCLKHRVIQPYFCWFKNPAFLTAKSSVNHGIFVLSTGFLPHMTSTFLGKTDRSPATSLISSELHFKKNKSKGAKGERGRLERFAKFHIFCSTFHS